MALHPHTHTKHTHTHTHTHTRTQGQAMAFLRKKIYHMIWSRVHQKMTRTPLCARNGPKAAARPCPIHVRGDCEEEEEEEEVPKRLRDRAEYTFVREREGGRESLLGSVLHTGVPGR